MQPSSLNATGFSERLTWPASELLKPFYHEAGHAVVARITGFDVAWVSVDEDFLRNDPLAIANFCDTGSPTCMTLSSALMSPILMKKRALNKSEKEVVISYCMHVLAGPFAEQYFDPSSYDPAMSERDMQQVEAVIASVEPSKPLQKKMLDTAKRNLKKIITSRWGDIESVSNALNEQKTLSGDEIDKLIDLSVLKGAA